MKKITKILAVALAMTLLAGSVACSKSSNGKSETGTKDPTILVMGTNAAFPPFEFLENNEIVGIDPEVMAAIAKEMNLTLKIVDMEFDSLPLALSNDQIDIIAAGLTVNPDREETMDFSDPYYTAAQTVIVAADSTVATKDDLSDKIIGVQAGTTGQTCAADVVQNKSQVKGFANGMLAVEALKNGQVNAVIIDNNPARVYGQENPDKLKLVEGLFDDEEYAFAVKKGNSVLLTKVNEALVKIKADGTFDAIIDKHMK